MDNPDTSKSATPFPTSGSSSQHMTGSPSAAHLYGADGHGQGGANAADEMLERIVQVAHETIDRLAGNAAPHVHRIQEQIGHVSETFNLKGSDLRATGDEWAEGLRDTVREHPIASMATAVALGMLLTRLTR